MCEVLFPGPEHEGNSHGLSLAFRVTRSPKAFIKALGQSHYVAQLASNSAVLWSSCGSLASLGCVDRASQKLASCSSVPLFLQEWWVSTVRPAPKLSFRDSTFVVVLAWVFNFMYMGTLPKCMSVHHVCTYKGQKEGTRSLRREITDKCGCLESKSSVRGTHNPLSSPSPAHSFWLFCWSLTI